LLCQHPAVIGEALSEELQPSTRALDARRVWRKACTRVAKHRERSDLDTMVFHGPRHTFISLALARQVDPQVVAKWAGFAQPPVTAR